MKIIVGLGNPGARYELTRHNIGFLAVDALCQKLGVRPTHRESQAFTATARIADEKLLLAKPQTYMNKSGWSVQPLQAYYKVETSDILVVYDDLALDFGRIRLRAKGSAGGHNGMKSIIDALGTQELPRLRIGIGPRPPHIEGVDYVLSRFLDSELEGLTNVIDYAVQALETWIVQGINAAMSTHNSACPLDDGAE